MDRARRAAQLTIPHLFPPDGAASGTEEFPDPYQSTGARGVNNLASKLLLTLLPPGAPFFRFIVDKESLQVSGQITQEDIAEIEQSAEEAARAVTEKVETLSLRAATFEHLRYQIVGGTSLMFLPTTEALKDRLPRTYHPEQFVAEHSQDGQVVALVIREEVSKETADPRLALMIQALPGTNSRKKVPLWTVAVLDDKGRYHLEQQIGKDAKAIPGTQGEFRKDEFPYLVNFINKKYWESYGRGVVQEYLGDLQSLEGLSQALVEAAAAAARLLFIVDPNSVMSPDIKQLANRPNGAFVMGDHDAIKALSLEKFADFQVTFSQAQEIKKDLQAVFLLSQALQRDAERVTAEEIRFMANELEATLGGVYSLQAQEFQLPMVEKIMRLMLNTKALREIPKDVKPKIITGIEGLGKGQELLRVRGFLQDLNATLGPEVVSQVLDVRKTADKLGSAYGIITAEILLSEEDAAEAQQNAQLGRITDSIGSAVVKEVGENSRQDTGG